MTSGLDLEAEYDVCAHVPDHPFIIEGWAREAAAYRAEVRPQVIPYGPSERQTIDVFAPDVHHGARTVVFIHGGGWQGLEPSLFSHLARGLNQHGITVAIPGYDLCPQVGLGDIVEELRASCLELGRFGRHLVTVGHSAGGHLAACMLATDWTAVRRDLEAPLVSSAYTLSGIFDLRPLLRTSDGEALRLDAAEAERLSPLLWRPHAGLSLDAVVGATESDAFRRQTLTIAQRWGEEGVATRAEELFGVNHFTIVAALADPSSAMTKRVAELALAPPL